MYEPHEPECGGAQACVEDRLYEVSSFLARPLQRSWQLNVGSSSQHVRSLAVTVHTLACIPRLVLPREASEQERAAAGSLPPGKHRTSP